MRVLDSIYLFFFFHIRNRVQNYNKKLTYTKMYAKIVIFFENC